MEINKSLVAIAVAMSLTGGAQSAGVSANTAQQNSHQGVSVESPNAVVAEQKETLARAMSYAANEALDFYVSNYVIAKKIGGSDLPEYFSPALKVYVGRFNLIQDRSFNDGLFLGDAKMVELGKSVKLPEKIDDWFLPLDAKAQKFNGGDATAGRDLILRLLCLAAFQEGIKPVQSLPVNDSLSLAQAEAYYYATVTRNLNFSNLFAAEIALKIQNSYKNQFDFQKDFIVALNQIPNEKLYAMFDQARTDLNNLEKITITIKDGESQNWEAGQFEYTVRRFTESLVTIKKNGHLIFGEGYVDGRLRAVEFSSIAKVSETTNRQDLPK